MVYSARFYKDGFITNDGVYKMNEYDDPDRVSDGNEF